MPLTSRSSVFWTAGGSATSGRVVQFDLGERADDDTQLMLDSINETEGLTYYTFRQIVSDVIVQGASVKLIVDADGTAICAVASLKSSLDIQLPEKPELTTEDVERIVDKTVGSSGYSIVKGLTHQAVVEINRTNRLVWVVYTDNPREDQDAGFFTFYVNDQGSCWTMRRS